MSASGGRSASRSTRAPRAATSASSTSGELAEKRLTVISAASACEPTRQRDLVQLRVLQRAQARPVALVGVAEAEDLQRRQAQRQARQVGMIARHAAR
jgi:hypothetical protein